MTISKSYGLTTLTTLTTLSTFNLKKLKYLTDKKRFNCFYFVLLCRFSNTLFIDMVRKNLWVYAAILATCGLGLFTSCNDGTTLMKVNGVLEEPVADKMPEQVEKAFATAQKVHPFEIMNDSANNVCVFGISELDGGVSTEGYGVMVNKNATSTTFNNIRNSRQPKAFYDAESNSLWLTSCVMEGTGTNVEQLYKMQFGSDNDSARIVATFEPFQMQQKILEQMSYSVKGEQIKFYANGVEIASAKNTVTDMGGLDAEQPIWVGEQISYDFGNGQPRVCFVPGVKFTTGLVLTYVDMPTLSASIDLKEDGNYTLSDFKAE